MDRTAPPARPPLGNAPRRFRGPFARWPRAADAVLATVVFLMTAFLVDGPGDAIVVRPIGDVPVAALLAFAVASAALYWRRRAPLAVLGVAVAAWATTLGSGYADLGGVAIIALYSAGRHATEAQDRWAKVGVAAAIAVVLIDGLTDPAPWGEAALGAVVMFVAWYVGRRLRLRSERAAQLQREQAAEARRIVIEERTRIARELHDVVAHRVSLMTVQAGAAKAVAAEDPEGALRAMAAVEEAGRQALDELRHLLGVLRPDTGLDGLVPQPGLADLPRLVEQTRGAGLDVSLATDGLSGELPARVDLFAYRIVQEALTNVLKHAGPGARAQVRLGGDRNGVVIEVVDDGNGSEPPSAAAGPIPTGRSAGRFRPATSPVGGARDRRDAGTGPTAGRDPGGPAAPGRRVPGRRPPAHRGRAGMSIRVAVVDDQALVRGGFAMVLRIHDDIEVVAEAGTGLEAIEVARQHRPDVILMDIRMPDMDGLEATSRILAEADWNVRVLILTTFDPDEYVYKALRAGASGFVLKDIPADQLAIAVRTVADGGALLAPSITRRLIGQFTERAGVDAAVSRRLERLTDREREVVVAVARGSSNAEIAEGLFIGAATVKSHVSSILTKLGLRDRTQLVVFAYESGLVEAGARDIGH